MKNNDFVHASLAQKAILRELIDRNIKAGHWTVRMSIWQVTGKDRFFSAAVSLTQSLITWA